MKRTKDKMSKRTYWVNMELEVIDESAMFKWSIKETDDGAISILYSGWDEGSQDWKKPSGDITIYGTDKAREIALRVIQLCDHIDDGKRRQDET